MHDLLVSFDLGEEIVGAALAAFEDDFEVMAARVLGPGAAEGGAGGDGVEEGEGVDIEEGSGGGGGVATGDDDAADLWVGVEEFCQELAGVVGEGEAVDVGAVGVGA